MPCDLALQCPTSLSKGVPLTKENAIQIVFPIIKKTWKLPNHNWAAVKAVLNQHWREKEYQETKANAPSPSSLHAHHTLFSKTMALIQWVFNLCKFTAPLRWNWYSKGPLKATTGMLIKILSPRLVENVKCPPYNLACVPECPHQLLGEAVWPELAGFDL